MKTSRKLAVRADKSGVSLVLGKRAVASGLAARLGASIEKRPRGRARATRGRDAIGAFSEKAFNLTGGGALSVRTWTGRAAAVVYVTPPRGAKLPGRETARVELGRLHDFKRGLALRRWCLWWLDPSFPAEPSETPDKVQLFLWERVGPGPRYAAAAPVGSPESGAVAFLEGCRSGVAARLDTWCDSRAPGRMPAVALALGNDPYALAEGVIALAIRAGGWPGRMRREKTYPAVFEQLGWCTWDAMYKDLTDAKVRRGAAGLRAGFPLGWVLLDDGWQRARGRSLVSFEPDRKKFPRGFRPLVRHLKRTLRVRWVGIWHAFQGHWEGVATKSKLARRFGKDLVPCRFGGERKTRALLANPITGGADRFYDAFHARLAEQGFDFIKVDNQGRVAGPLENRIPAARAMSGMQLALQRAAGRHFDQNLINCMAMTREAAYSWADSNVVRNSDDVKFPGRLSFFGRHLRQNAYNAVWTSAVGWPDWDMFQSTDRNAEAHAAARAISGGPVYVSDKVGEHDFDVIWKLIDATGAVLRPDEPAVPTRGTLFSDPRETRGLLKVFTRAGSAGLLAAFNVKLDNLASGGCMEPTNVDGLRGTRFAVYEHHTHELRVMRRNESWAFDLAAGEYRLWSLVPLANGFAAVGLAEKFISPRTVLCASRRGRTHAIALGEGGTLVCASTRRVRRVVLDGKPLARSRWKQSGAKLTVRTGRSRTPRMHRVSIET